MKKRSTSINYNTVKMGELWRSRRLSRTTMAGKQVQGSNGDNSRNIYNGI